MKKNGGAARQERALCGLLRFSVDCLPRSFGGGGRLKVSGTFDYSLGGYRSLFAFGSTRDPQRVCWLAVVGPASLSALHLQGALSPKGSLAHKTAQAGRCSKVAD